MQLLRRGAASMEWVHPGQETSGKQGLGLTGCLDSSRVEGQERKTQSTGCGAGRPRVHPPPWGLSFPSVPREGCSTRCICVFSKADLCLGCAPTWNALLPQI